MLIKWLKRTILIAALLCCVSSVWAKPNVDVVAVSVSVSNQTTLPFGSNFTFFIDRNALNYQLNMDQNAAPAVGKMVVLLPSQSGTVLRLNMFNMLNRQDVDLCKIEIKTDQPYHATMRLIDQDTTQPYVCTFSGDPNNDTALITITAKTTGQLK